MIMKFYIPLYHPINLHGEEIRFVNFFNQGKELWQRQKGKLP